MCTTQPSPKHKPRVQRNKSMTAPKKKKDASPPKKSQLLQPESIVASTRTLAVKPTEPKDSSKSQLSVSCQAPPTFKLRQWRPIDWLFSCLWRRFYFSLMQPLDPGRAARIYSNGRYSLRRISPLRSVFTLTSCFSSPSPVCTFFLLPFPLFCIYLDNMMKLHDFWNILCCRVESDVV